MVRFQMDAGAFRVQSTPLYSQLSSVFRDLITQEEWPIGKAIPSEAELARKFGVSVGTTRKALETLEVGGWVTRKQGRGTFVADPSERQLHRFCRIFLKGTCKSAFSDCVASTLKCETRSPSEREAADLQIGTDEKVIHLVRRLNRAGAPFMLEKQTLPEALLPDFTKIENLPTNLFKILLQNYGIVVGRCEERVCVSAAPAEVSETLHLRPNASVMHTSREVFDIDNRVVALVERWFETSDVEYSITLT